MPATCSLRQPPELGAVRQSIRVKLVHAHCAQLHEAGGLHPLCRRAVGLGTRGLRRQGGGEAPEHLLGEGLPHIVGDFEDKAPPYSVHERIRAAGYSTYIAL